MSSVEREAHISGLVGSEGGEGGGGGRVNGVRGGNKRLDFRFVH